MRDDFRSDGEMWNIEHICVENIGMPHTGISYILYPIYIYRNASHWYFQILCTQQHFQECFGDWVSQSFSLHRLDQNEANFILYCAFQEQLVSFE